MAWRLHQNLIEGELDNTVLGKVIGWMKFKGLKGKVQFNLKGNFHRDIRGAKIKFRGEGKNRNIREGRNYMNGFSLTQTGDAGDITGGFPVGHNEQNVPIYDYGSNPYIEWYANNGRCLIELDHSQIEVIGTPIPASQTKPISRENQYKLMLNFLNEVSVSLNS